jgi:hypothetical protein
MLISAWQESVWQLKAEQSRAHRRRALAQSACAQMQDMLAELGRHIADDGYIILYIVLYKLYSLVTGI